MTIYETTQVNTLLGNAPMVALVGDRIYPRELPGGAVLPAVTYRLISSPRNMTQQGAALVRPRYQWDCWAREYDESVEVAIALMQALGEGRWVDDEGDHDEPLTGLFRRRVEILGWTNPPEMS